MQHHLSENNLIIKNASLYAIPVALCSICTMSFSSLFHLIHSSTLQTNKLELMIYQEPFFSKKKLAAVYYDANGNYHCDEWPSV
mmetsp:Transcript_4010/g.6804  ORF Transcript_4010/g.6804 Transcript_4010/m.6804 type:complete len:84 (+) Transcript_4010:49-300(+)